MTYVFPPSLHPLRDYLRGLGADTIAFASARQAAFMAQQLLGTRVKFPPQGQDMMSTLFLIQKAVTEKGIRLDAPAVYSSDVKPNRHKKDFSPAVFAKGVHIFCDGAAVPNPGAGGWGVVVYRDGVECSHTFGGEPDTTNNKMEMTALLNAIEKAKGYSGAEYPSVTIWSDSQYCVNGANDWRHKWKRNGWKPSPAAAEHVKNVDLWKAIDDALGGETKSGSFSIKWVKGHAGVLGNERADELAEEGRARIIPDQNNSAEDLDAQYRAIMAG